MVLLELYTALCMGVVAIEMISDFNGWFMPEEAAAGKLSSHCQTEYLLEFNIL